MRKMVTFAKDWKYTTFGGKEKTIPAGRRMKLDYPTDYVDKNGDVIFGHWWGYGQPMRIPKEYFKNTA